MSRRPAVHRPHESHLDLRRKCRSDRGGLCQNGEVWGKSFYGRLGRLAEQKLVWKFIADSAKSVMLSLVLVHERTVHCPQCPDTEP